MTVVSMAIVLGYSIDTKDNDINASNKEFLETIYPTPFCFAICIYLPYRWKIWRGIKFGSLAVCLATTKLKSANISYSHVHMAIPY